MTEVTSVKKAFTLRVSPDVSEKIEEAAFSAGISSQELIRRAIGTELFLIDERKKGSKALIENDGKVRELVFR